MNEDINAYFPIYKFSEKQFLDTQELDNILNEFDTAIAIQVTLKAGETFYFERRIEDNEYKMSFEEAKQKGLILFDVFGCVRKPFKTEDFVLTKSLAVDGKVRFLIWCSDICFKYGISVPENIRRKALELDDFDVLSRHSEPMDFMRKVIKS